MSGTTDTGDLLEVCADLIGWSENTGLRGDYPGLWRKHDGVRRRLAKTRLEGSFAKKVLWTEVEVWIETLPASVRLEFAQPIAAELARSSDVWAPLGGHARANVPSTSELRARSCRTAFAAAALRFRASPDPAHVAEMLRAVWDLIVVGPDIGSVDEDALGEALDRLVHEIRDQLPTVAAGFLGSLVEARYRERTGGAIEELRYPDGERRVPTWERLVARYETPEPVGIWFVPAVQSEYEHARLFREVDDAHGRAIEEDKRRRREIEDEDRRREAEERVAKEEQARKMAARQNEEERARAVCLAEEQAVEVVRDRLEARGVTLKHVPEPERSQMIRAAQEEILRRWGW